MEQEQAIHNPFRLMIDPQQVLHDMSRSDALGALQHRTCRPLDRPVLRALHGDLLKFDAEVDQGFIELAPEDDAWPAAH
jgi:hypothetical protein